MSDTNPDKIFPLPSKPDKINKSKETDVDNPPKKPNGWSNSAWKYVIAGVISGIFIAAFLWVADKIGSMWGALIASIPVSLVVAIIFIRADRLHNFIFALILGTIAYLVAAVIFFVLCTSTGINKWVNLIIALIAWIIVIGFLFWSFREELKDKN